MFYSIYDENQVFKNFKYYTKCNNNENHLTKAEATSSSFDSVKDFIVSNVSSESSHQINSYRLTKNVSLKLASSIDLSIRSTLSNHKYKRIKRQSSSYSFNEGSFKFLI